MEIKKSKKILKTLIATSFVGVVAAPIALTSCSKKSDFKKTVYDSLKVEVVNAKNKSNSEVNASFSLNDEKDTATLVCVVGDTTEGKDNKNYGSFDIVLNLPFEKDATDGLFVLEGKPVVESVGKLNDKANKGKNYVNVGEVKEEDKGKKLTYHVDVNDVLGMSEKNAENDTNGKPTKVKLSSEKTYSTIKFKFVDKKDKNKSCEFTVKVCFEEKKNNN